ncbi:MAG: hypothetical protein R8M45_09210 [Ghiorsea sp.]
MSSVRERSIQELKEFQSPQAVIDVSYRVHILHELEYIKLAYFHDIMDGVLFTTMSDLPNGYSFVKALEIYNSSRNRDFDFHTTTYKDYCDFMVRTSGESLATIYLCEALHLVDVASVYLLNDDEMNFCGCISEANAALSMSLGMSGQPPSDMSFFKQSGKKGGEALSKDNTPFKKKYRQERDNANNKGITRRNLIDIIDMNFTAPLSSLEKWAKEADKEDNFVRKAGRPPAKKGS